VRPYSGTTGGAERHYNPGAGNGTVKLAPVSIWSNPGISTLTAATTTLTAATRY
jgi:hypothetical protein